MTGGKSAGGTTLLSSASVKMGVERVKTKIESSLCSERNTEAISHSSEPQDTDSRRQSSSKFLEKKRVKFHASEYLGCLEVGQTEDNFAHLACNGASQM